MIWATCHKGSLLTELMASYLCIAYHQWCSAPHFSQFRWLSCHFYQRTAFQKFSWKSSNRFGRQNHFPSLAQAFGIHKPQILHSEIPAVNLKIFSLFCIVGAFILLSHTSQKRFLRGHLWSLLKLVRGFLLARPQIDLKRTLKYSALCAGIEALY